MAHLRSASGWLRSLSLSAFVGLITACSGGGDSGENSDINGQGGQGTKGGAGGNAAGTSQGGTAGKAGSGVGGASGKAGDSATAGTDAGGTDAGGTDAGGTDAGGTDAGGTDAGGTDAGGTDAGGTDAGGTDAGGTDAGGTDAGGTDAGGTNAGGSGGSGVTISDACQGCIAANCDAEFNACAADPACLACATGDPTAPGCLGNANLLAAVACACQPTACAATDCAVECAIFGGGQGGSGGAGGSGCAPEETLCGETCINTQTSTTNCGACGVTCNSANGEASCVAGVCDITCSAGFDKCGGDCVDFQTDTLHCGNCDTKCSTNNGEASCASGACAINCAAGFADCDGDLTNGCEVNGSCACTPGEQVDCYDGPDGTKDVGLCKGGKKTCNAEGTGYGACEGQVLPAVESCAAGAATDEDCDGQVNEGGGDASCACAAGSQTSCYEGPFGTAGVGLCKGGLKTCLPDGTGYGACEGQVLPAVESCAAGATTDEDCDGQVNEDGAGCVCVPGAFQPCYDNGLNSPELNTANGLCVAGIQQCSPDGTGYGACQGQVLPTAEICDVNGVDENCNGQSNEGGVGCDCVPGASEACWEGPASAVFGGTSVCKKGSRTCQPSGKWGSCTGQVLPGVEPLGLCTANVDEDCDGNAQGPGAQDLDGDGWTACGGDCCETTAQCTEPKLVNPGAFDVAGNNLDDDCDGTKDNAVATCGAGLASNSGTAMDYAKAMDLCQTTTEGATGVNKKWGVISATFSLANGAGTPTASSRSIRPSFGSGGLNPKKGPNLAVLSTGGAADLTDTNPGYQDFQIGVDTGTSSPVPADWLASNGGTIPNAPGCPGPGSNTAYNPVMLKLRIRVPTNAKSFSFDSFFMSSEYPEWVCTPYNDFFVALLNSSFAGQPANPADRNLAVYDPPPVGGSLFPVGVNLAKLNNGLFQVCKNGTIGCAGSNGGTISTCSQGTGLLTGTGMDIAEGGCGTNNLTGGGTGYLTSSGNIVPGETIEMRFAIWDTGDGIYDSVVLLDNWTWSLNAAQPGTVISQ